MLERYSNKPSKRLENITSFLEQAVKIVPIESILFAIGHDELDIAVECAKALVSANLNIPYSRMAHYEALRVAFRMKTGLPGREFDHVVAVTNNILSQIIFSPAFPHPSFSPHPPNTSVQAPTYSNIVQRTSLQRVMQQTTQPDVTHQVGIKFAVQGNIPGQVFPKLADPGQVFPKLADWFDRIATTIQSKQTSANAHHILSNWNIEQVYPVNSTRRHSVHQSTLKSPIEILKTARSELENLLESANEDLDSSTQGTQTSNELMLDLVKEINDRSLRICASLIGAFMEQQICIPLLKSEADTANVLSEKSSPVAMGVWALFSLGFSDLQSMLTRMQGNPLLVKITDYISGVVTDDLDKSSNQPNAKYAGKLQFLLQGMRSNTISCSSQYISYSLEHQLCSNLKFEKDITVKKLVKDWNKIFRKDALSLVAPTYRPLVARWLKWAVIVHDLRESLACYTCVGVTGLINSGKSCLVSTLFDLQV